MPCPCRYLLPNASYNVWVSGFVLGTRLYSCGSHPWTLAAQFKGIFVSGVWVRWGPVCCIIKNKRTAFSGLYQTFNVRATEVVPLSGTISFWVLLLFELPNNSSIFVWVAFVQLSCLHLFCGPKYVTRQNNMKQSMFSIVTPYRYTGVQLCRLPFGCFNKV